MSAASLRNQAPTATLFLLCILVVPIAVYWPGLGGPFMLDDLHNLEPLGFAGGVYDLDLALNFVFSGQSGPLGRPLVLATFLLDDNGWPADPQGFKLTNLSIHLLCGIVLFLVAYRIAAILGRRRESAVCFATLVAGAWLVHPFNVSTTLYVIQRMTQLATLFSLLAIYCFLRGRLLLAVNPAKGYLLLTVAMGPLYLLAVLCKESAAMLPLQLLAIEATLLHGLESHRRYRQWCAVFLFVPLLLIAAYFLVSWDGVMASYQIRSFNLSERLMTETRVLVEYMGNTLFPRASGMGLFHDDYVVSRSLLEPASTLFCMIFLAALAVSALVCRRRYPAFGFGVLFFLAGHLLEAGFVPLELYFEHRNYLHMFGLLFAAGWGLLLVFDRFEAKTGKVVRPLAVAGLFLLLAMQTAVVASSYSDNVRNVNLLYLRHPDSYRVNLIMAQTLFEQGSFRQSESVYRNMLRTDPTLASPRIAIFRIRCLAGVVGTGEFDELLEVLRTGTLRFGTGIQLDSLLADYDAGRCDFLDAGRIHEIFSAITENPFIRLYNINRYHYLWAQRFKVERNLSGFMENMLEAYSMDPDYRLVIEISEALVSAGLVEEARRIEARHEKALEARRTGISLVDRILDYRDGYWLKSRRQVVPGGHGG